MQEGSNLILSGISNSTMRSRVSGLWRRELVPKHWENPEHMCLHSTAASEHAQGGQNTSSSGTERKMFCCVSDEKNILNRLQKGASPDEKQK